MRRHAEGLIILSGATPGRAWRNPVDLTDVVRAAAAEAEDYPRVEVRRMPRARVLGPVVADLTHLLAELIENATSFSPPHTRVVVGGEPVGSGFAIEIEDRGLGMSPEALREANRRIGESSGDDLFDSDRLGLFVVSRLARRHEVRVSLCASAYGGITAVVLIPSGVMQPPGESGEHPLPEHDLGVSGAMPHGPLAGPGRTAVPGDAANPPFDRRPPRPAPPDPLDESAAAAHRSPAPVQEAAPAAPRANGYSPHSDTVQPRPFEVQPRPFDVLGLAEAQGPENGDGAHPALGPDGLPHRVRQASLAPQLRLEPAAEPPAGASAPGDAPHAPRPPRPQRTPEQNRATMSAFQRGFTLGRAEEPAAPPPPTASPAAEAGRTRAADHDERGDGPR